ncbi:MAG TPA: hypothetical protein VMU18_07165 [Rhodoblastus sp.]|nr:hypothetical protein [Rhodoblastus sp.]
MARWIRLGAALALCTAMAGCDPCGGWPKFSKFPGACNYEQSK